MCSSGGRDAVVLHLDAGDCGAFNDRFCGNAKDTQVVALLGALEGDLSPLLFAAKLVLLGLIDAGGTVKTRVGCMF